MFVCVPVCVCVCLCVYVSLCVCVLRMMEVNVGHYSMLLARSEGRFSALGNQCTHYGAPLSKGAALQRFTIRLEATILRGQGV